MQSEDRFSLSSIATPPGASPCRRSPSAMRLLPTREPSSKRRPQALGLPARPPLGGFNCALLVRRHAGGTNTSPIYLKPGMGKVLEHALPFAPDAVLVFGAGHRVSLSWTRLSRAATLLAHDPGGSSTTNEGPLCQWSSSTPRWSMGRTAQACNSLTATASGEDSPHEEVAVTIP